MSVSASEAYIRLPGRRLRVDEAARLCMVMPVLAFVVSMSLGVLVILFDWAQSLGSWVYWALWVFWALGALLSAVAWLTGVVLALLCLVRARDSKLSGSVRTMSIAGLVLSLLLCWAPLLPFGITIRMFAGY